MWSRNNANGDGEKQILVEELKLVNVKPLDVLNASEFVLVHTAIDLQPVRTPSEVNFCCYLLQNMRNMGFKQLMRLQSYAWQHLNCGNEYATMIVGPSQSGRTLSYVPPIVEFVFRTFEEKQLRIQRGTEKYRQGAIAIVITSDLERLSKVFILCRALLRNVCLAQHYEPIVHVPSKRSTTFLLQMLKGVGIVVATASQFLWLKNEELKFCISPDLGFLVLDDIDLMPADILTEVNQFISACYSANQKLRTRLVITSKTYNPNHYNLLLCQAQPLMLFADILEAFVHGKGRMKMYMTKSANKLQLLLDLIKKRSPLNYHTIVYCQNNSEVAYLVAKLKHHNYNCLSYCQNSNALDREQLFHWINECQTRILVCSDKCEELLIGNVYSVYHYNLPNTWSEFERRHIVCQDNIRNAFHAKSTDVIESENVESFVLLDENNSEQLPRLVDFMQKHNMKVDENLVKLARSVREEMKVAKSRALPLCTALFTRGDCDQANCKNRHQILAQDHPSPCEPQPRDSVKLFVFKVYSPNHYCARLLEHLPHKSENWESRANFSQLHKVTTGLQFHYGNESNCVNYWPPIPNEVCVYYSNYSNCYERVRVVSVPNNITPNLMSTDIVVQVQAMDTNRRVFKARIGVLYVCPNELRTLPAMAIDVRLLAIVPFTGENIWYATDAKICSDWLDRIGKQKDNFIQSTIAFSFSHTLFVHDLEALYYVPTMNIHIQRESLIKFLLREKLAKKDITAKGKILQICGDYIEQNITYQQLETKEQKNGRAQGQVSRLHLITKLGLLVGMENRLSLERTEAIKELEEKTKTNDNQIEMNNDLVEKLNNKEVNEMEHQIPLEVGFEDFLKCFQKCLTLDETEYNQAAGQHEVNENGLPINDSKWSKDCIQKSSASTSQTLCQIQLKCKSYKSKHLKTKNRNSLRGKIYNRSELPQYLREPPTLPPGHKYPEVLYYQTRPTLELSVVLPEDNLLYNACLCSQCKMSIHFSTYCTGDHDKQTLPIYSFELYTYCAYTELNHYRQGRRVYISIRKQFCEEYPLPFQAYKFMKPNHDKFNLIKTEQDVIRNRALHLFKDALQSYEGASSSNEDGCESSDDQCLDDIEQPVFNNEFN